MKIDDFALKYFVDFILIFQLSFVIACTRASLRQLVSAQPVCGFDWPAFNFLSVSICRLAASLCDANEAVAVFRDESFSVFRVQELCESRGGRPGLDDDELMLNVLRCQLTF